eukprot:6826620-Alexandrium_andersonii.AAC.1
MRKPARARASPQESARFRRGRGGTTQEQWGSASGAWVATPCAPGHGRSSELNQGVGKGASWLGHWLMPGGHRRLPGLQE